MADTRPIFEWLDVIKRKGIVYVGLDALSDFTVSAAVGNSMFADLVAIAGHIYKHGVDAGVPEVVRDRNKPKISIHADEVNELMGNEFIPLLNKAGGAGVQVHSMTLVSGVTDTSDTTAGRKISPPPTKTASTSTTCRCWPPPI